MLAAGAAAVTVKIHRINPQITPITQIWGESTPEETEGIRENST